MVTYCVALELAEEGRHAGMCSSSAPSRAGRAVRLPESTSRNLQPRRCSRVSGTVFWILQWRQRADCSAVGRLARCMSQVGAKAGWCTGCVYDDPGIRRVVVGTKFDAYLGWQYRCRRGSAVSERLIAPSPKSERLPISRPHHRVGNFGAWRSRREDQDLGGSSIHHR